MSGIKEQMEVAYALSDCILAEVEQTEFTFDELSERAKEKVRGRYRETQLDYEWWEYVYEDAVTLGALIGIEVGTNRSAPKNGKSYTEPDISFSGFCNQGDGCCYSGTLHIDQLQGCEAKVKAECSDPLLLSIARDGEALFRDILVARVAQRMQGVASEDAMTEYSRFSIIGNSRYYATCTDNDDEQFDLDDYVSSFADWIYGRLEAEHDYLMSDECIDESIKQYETLYDEFGSEV
jgi:hypothetical protein